MSSKMTQCMMTGVVCVILAGVASSEEDPGPFLGQWNITLENGDTGWMDIVQKEGYLDGRLLWRWASPRALDSVYLFEGAMTATWNQTVERNDKGEGPARSQVFTETFFVAHKDGTLQGMGVSPHHNGLGADVLKFTAVPAPPLPPCPDLAKVKYAAATDLLENGLKGWKLVQEGAASGWSFDKGILRIDPVQPEGGPYIHYGHLRTLEEFEDFRLMTDVRVTKNSNSGIFLRGLYEIQVEDSYERELDSHGMGSVYGRIAPVVKAEKPAGEWQTLDMTLVDRHVTVILNGVTIIDNQAIEGCTGGALSSDVEKSGPIYLQVHNGSVQYRNLLLTPVVR